MIFLLIDWKQIQHRLSKASNGQIPVMIREAIVFMNSCGTRKLKEMPFYEGDLKLRKMMAPAITKGAFISTDIASCYEVKQLTIFPSPDGGGSLAQPSGLYKEYVGVLFVDKVKLETTNDKS